MSRVYDHNDIQHRFRKWSTNYDIFSVRYPIILALNKPEMAIMQYSIFLIQESHDRIQTAKARRRLRRTPRTYLIIVLLVYHAGEQEIPEIN